MYRHGNVKIFKLESNSIQVEVNERDSDDFHGFVLYFDDDEECDRAYWRIVSADCPLAYAKKIFDNQRSAVEQRDEQVAECDKAA